MECKPRFKLENGDVFDWGLDEGTCKNNYDDSAISKNGAENVMFVGCKIRNSK
jgi:hypothetical protein